MVDEQYNIFHVRPGCVQVVYLYMMSGRSESGWAVTRPPTCSGLV
jgi:hypothetical protein